MDTEKIPSQPGASRRWPHWLWPLALTLAGILGLGNGMWSHFTEPTLIWARNAALNAITLGIESQKDEVYRHAARGFHEHTASTTLLALIWLVSSLVGMAIGQVFGILNSARSRFIGEQVKRPITERLLTGNPDQNPVGTYKRMRIVLLTAVLVFTYIVGVVGARTLKGHYCTAAISYYNQLRAVVAPHISQHKLLEYDAKFAIVQGRSDYAALMQELDAEARIHTSKVPAFYVW